MDSEEESKRAFGKLRILQSCLEIFILTEMAILFSFVSWVFFGHGSLLKILYKYGGLCSIAFMFISGLVFFVWHERLEYKFEHVPGWEEGQKLINRLKILTLIIPFLYLFGLVAFTVYALHDWPGLPMQN